MITLILIAALLIVLLILSMCFHLVGGVLKLVLKLLICLPCALVMAVVGLAFCCTLILIPLGIGCFKLAGCLLSPLHGCFA
ncbi:MAG: YccF domain-containing protein [Suilimivivens sp.]